METATGLAGDGRLHAMDQLRALAMLAGVLFHAALAYSPLMQPIFPTADRQVSDAVDAVVWGLHLVRMPLFFLVAGFFAARVMARRGQLALMRQRLRRVALPFVLAWPLVLLALSAATEWAATRVAHPSPMLLAIRDWMAMPDAPDTPPTTAHLWFLYYLALFTVLHWALGTLGAGRAAAWLLRQPPALLLSLLPLLLVPALASVSAPHPAPEGLLPQFWALVFFGAFFALGAQLHGQPQWLEHARRLGPVLAAGCLLLYPLFLWRLAIEPPGPAQPTASWSMAVLQACLSLWLTVGGLMLGTRLLARASTTMRYLADGAYWIYLLHLPLLFVVQYRLMDLELHWGLKFAIASAVTLAACLLSYQLLVRHTPLRRLVG